MVFTSITPPHGLYHPSAQRLPLRLHGLTIGANSEAVTKLRRAF